MSLSTPFIHRPVASSFMALAIILLGLLAWRMLPVAPLPQIDFPTIVVRANLPGASPESMAATVATPLERSLASISGIDALFSSSNQGATQVIVQFNPERNIHDAARDVQAAINRALTDLPSGMPSAPNFVKVNPSQAPIMGLALSSKDALPSALYDSAATILAQKLAQVAGVGEVSIAGSSLPAVRVQLNPGALAHQGIALDEVRNAIAAGNAPRPLGNVQNDNLRWQIGLNADLRDAADFEQLIIRYNNDQAVRLGDIAEVTDSVENRYSSGFYNHQPAVIMLISRQTGANIIETIDAIKKELPALRALIPANSELNIVMDRSPGIRATLSEAQLTLLVSALLVIGVAWAFLGSLRAAAIPSAVIPVSIIGTFAVMYFLGFSLNNLSVLALIVATGLVVDDAIVVLENIQRHIQLGMSPVEAAITGTREVGFTLLAMNIALVVVFISILFMGGLVERLFREFTLTLAATIVLSLWVSITLTPSLCAHWLKGNAADVPNTRFMRAFSHLEKAYQKSLRWALRFAPLVLLSLVLTLFAGSWFYQQLPKGMLPQQDSGQIRGFVRGDDGFSFQVMQPKLNAFREFVLTDPAVQDVTGTSGGTSGLSNAMFTIQLKPLAERDGMTTEQVINRLRRNAPAVAGAVFNFSVDQDLQLRSPFNQTSYAVTLMSGDLGELREWAIKVSNALQDRSEFSFIQGYRGESAQQVVIEFDRDMARRLGVDMQMVTSVLGNAFSQRQVATLYERMNQYRVVLELEPQYTQSPEVLEQLQVITHDGDRIPLSSFAKWRYGLANDRIFHDNQFAAINIGYELAEGIDMQTAGMAIDSILAELMLPIDIMAVHGANSRGQNQNALAAPPLLLILGVIIAVYLVLGMLYESLLHPLTIISTLPSAGIGALFALYITGTEFTLIALLGLFLLIGIVMKNAILMVDFALTAEKQGMSAESAIQQAALLRMRPILMTNLAGLLGALPLVLGMGDGAELRRPLGIAIMGGLAVSQILTLYTTPVVYLYLDKFKQFCSKIST